MNEELKNKLTERFNSAYGEEVKIGLRDALRKVYLDGVEHGYQYAVEKAFDILSQMLYTKRDDEHPAQHYTRSVESIGKFVSQTDFLNQFKQKMQ